MGAAREDEGLVTHTNTSSTLPGSMAPLGTVRETAVLGMDTLAPASPTLVQEVWPGSAHLGRAREEGEGRSREGVARRRMGCSYRCSDRGRSSEK